MVTTMKTIMVVQLSLDNHDYQPQLNHDYHDYHESPLIITHLTPLHCDFQYSSVHGTKTTHCVYEVKLQASIYIQSMHTFCVS